jgi:hypothetical protein
MRWAADVLDAASKSPEQKKNQKKKTKKTKKKQHPNVSFFSFQSGFVYPIFFIFGN